RLFLGGCIPAPRRVVVRALRLDPIRSFVAVLLLPERRARLEVVHDEFAGRERIAAVRARHRDEHDLIARLQLAVAMDHARVAYLPARFRFLHDLRDLALGHPGVVLEGHGDLAHQADEARDGAYLPVSGQVSDFETGIKVLALDRDLHPPVTGGKNATSSPALMRAPACTMSWFTAVRTRVFWPKAFSNAS